jgi:hypothetical protein
MIDGVMPDPEIRVRAAIRDGGEPSCDLGRL